MTLTLVPRWIDFSQNDRAAQWTGEYCFHRTAGPYESWLNAWRNGSGSAHRAIQYDGTIYEYIEITKVAWHSGDHAYNQRSIGIEIVCNDPGNNGPVSDAQLLAAYEFLNSIRDQASGPLRGSIHRDHVATYCPGDDAVGPLRDLINKIDNQLPYTPNSEEISMSDVQDILNGLANVAAAVATIENQVESLETSVGVINEDILTLAGLQFYKCPDDPNPGTIWGVLNGKRDAMPNVPQINNGANLGPVRWTTWRLLSSVPQA